jgi:hypothetical protein
MVLFCLEQKIANEDIRKLDTTAPKDASKLAFTELIPPKMKPDTIRPSTTNTDRTILFIFTSDTPDKKTNSARFG